MSDLQLPPDYRTPIVRPEKTWKDKIKWFFSSPQVHGALVTSTIMLFLGLISTLYSCSRVVGENRSLQKENQSKAADIGNLKLENLKLSNEKATAENALAPWVQLANSQFTNTPVTKRLDKLFEAVAANVDAFTNVLTSVNLQIPSLAVSINGSNMPPVVAFGDWFPITVYVKNIGELAAGRITVSINTTVAETNTFAAGWQKEFPGGMKIAAQHVWSDEHGEHRSPDPYSLDLPMNHWVIGAGHLLGAGETFMAPIIYFTNTFKNLDGYNMFPVEIAVQAERSRTYRGTIILVSPRKGGDVKFENGMLILN